MVNSFLIFACIILLFVIIRSTYLSEKNNVILVKLTENYSAKVKRPPKIKRQMFYFWSSEKPNEKDYINGMYIHVDGDGVYIEPTIFNFWINSMFIPWSDLNKIGSMERYFEKKDVYLIDSLGVTIAFGRDN